MFCKKNELHYAMLFLHEIDFNTLITINLKNRNGKSQYYN